MECEEAQAPCKERCWWILVGVGLAAAVEHPLLHRGCRLRVLMGDGGSICPFTGRLRGGREFDGGDVRPMGVSCLGRFALEG